MSALLLNAISATTSAPSAETDGVSWSRYKSRDAALIIKDRAGSGTMTLTARLWGMAPVKNNATGTITFVSVANHVDAETVVVSDGINAVTFEIDKAGDGVTAGRVQVDISTDTTNAEVATRFGTALQSKINDGTLRVTYSVASEVVTIKNNNRNGTTGNVTITETVANGTFAVTGMSGGVDFVWVPLGTHVTGTSKGLINEASAVDESTSDNLEHCEVISNLDCFERLYLQVTAIGGTATAVDAILVPLPEMS